MQQRPMVEPPRRTFRVLAKGVDSFHGALRPCQLGSQRLAASSELELGCGNLLVRRAALLRVPEMPIPILWRRRQTFRIRGQLSESPQHWDRSAQSFVRGVATWPKCVRRGFRCRNDLECAKQRHSFGGAKPVNRRREIDLDVFRHERHPARGPQKRWRQPARSRPSSRLLVFYGAVERYPRRQPITTWDALKVAIAQIENSGRKTIYRGVTKFPKHDLTPTIGRKQARKNPKNGKPVPYSEAEEKRFLDLFRRDAPLKERPYTDIELLAIAQHHGASTRLLDWTWDPVIAAFFATETAGTTGVPAVYVIDIPEALRDAEDPFSISEVRSYEPPPYLPLRIGKQRSVLTVHPRPAEPYDSPDLEVWLFPEDRRSFELKLEIDASGSNRSQLFPDLGGVAEYLGWLYKWGRLPPS